MPIPTGIEPLFLRILTAVMISDEHIDMDEIVRIKEIYQIHTGDAVGDTEIQVAYDELKATPVTVVDELKAIVPPLDTEVSETILKAALEISGSDGKLEEKEQSLIVQCVEALSIPHERYAQLVQETLRGKA